MGAEPWFYFVPYEENIQHALDTLRREVFQAGRFRGSEMNPPSIDEALANSHEEGTASILDVDHISTEAEIGSVTPLTSEELMDLFDTEQPTREMAEASESLYETVGRGAGVCFIAYDRGKPSGIVFAGYSVD